MPHKNYTISFSSVIQSTGYRTKRTICHLGTLTGCHTGSDYGGPGGEAKMPSEQMIGAVPARGGAQADSKRQEATRKAYMSNS